MSLIRLTRFTSVLGADVVATGAACFLGARLRFGAVSPVVFVAMCTFLSSALLTSYRTYLP
jgi:hypothetical protein